MKVWILEAESRSVPGRVQEAHYTRASAYASARRFRKDFGDDLEYVDVRWLAVLPRPAKGKG